MWEESGSSATVMTVSGRGRSRRSELSSGVRYSDAGTYATFSSTADGGRMKLHVVINKTTGESFIQGTKRRYSAAEYETAKRDAERGGGAVDEQHWADNCPECQAERAQAERALVIKPKRWPNRPRWRTMRRAVRGTR